MYDLDKYWTKIDSSQSVKHVINKLNGKGLVSMEQRGNDTSVYLPHSVRDFLKEEMANTLESVAVRFMLIKNYC